MTRDDPAAFAPPPAFGPFRVLHQIGIGALGPVFRTYEPTRDRLVAVKVFRLDMTPEQAQSLADELARAADAGLFHPSIVEPVAAGVEGTVAYRAEEYVAAESLDVAMRHYAPAALDHALPFLTQLAGAIDFARTAGVGHGALHLRDVFVTPDEARASGFGIVEALERVGVRAPVRRPYSAPERIAGAAWSTPADVFSLAAIAYELLTGRRPSGTGEQIGDVSGDNLGGKAAAIRAVLARAMHDDPARRYATALGFASALEAAAHARNERISSVVAVPQQLIPEAPLPPSPPDSGECTDALIGGLGTDATSCRSGTGISPSGRTSAGRDGDEGHRNDEDTVDEDDVAAERDADTAHHRLTADVEEEAEPTLFDDAEEESTPKELDSRRSQQISQPERRRSSRDGATSRFPRTPSAERRRAAPAFGSTRLSMTFRRRARRRRASLVPWPSVRCSGLASRLGHRPTGGGIRERVETTAPPAQARGGESTPGQPTAATGGELAAARSRLQRAGGRTAAQAAAARREAGNRRRFPVMRRAAVRPWTAKAVRLRRRPTRSSADGDLHADARGRDGQRTMARPHAADARHAAVRSYTVRVVQPGFTASSEESSSTRASRCARSRSVCSLSACAAAAPARPATARRIRRARAARPVIRIDLRRFAPARRQGVHRRQADRHDAGEHSRHADRDTRRQAGARRSPRLVDQHQRCRRGEARVTGSLERNTMKATLALENGLGTKAKRSAPPARPAARSSSTPA